MAGRVQIRGGNLARLNALVADVQGTGSQRLREAMKRVLIEGNTFDRLRGVDFRGRPLAKLAPSTLAPAGIRRRGGSGPALCPKGLRSRSIAGFKVRATGSNEKGWEIVASIDALSRKGYPFLVAHATGTAPRCPRRDIVSGVSPRTAANGERARREWLAGIHRRNR